MRLARIITCGNQRHSALQWGAVFAFCGFGLFLHGHSAEVAVSSTDHSSCAPGGLPGEAPSVRASSYSSCAPGGLQGEAASVRASSLCDRAMCPTALLGVVRSSDARSHPVYAPETVALWLTSDDPQAVAPLAELPLLDLADLAIAFAHWLTQSGMPVRQLEVLAAWLVRIDDWNLSDIA